MKINIALTLPFAITGVLFAAIALFVFRPVLALVDASSSPNDISTSTDLTATSSDDITTTSTTTVSSSPQSTSTPSESSAQTLTEVHIIGKKYVDYFSDGTTLTSFPGDPKIVGNLDQPNAQTPSHDGLTWDHTSTQSLYDTASGDLEPGDYAKMPSGTYIAHYPTTVYTDATSTVQQPDRITMSGSIPTWDHLTPSSDNSTSPAVESSQSQAGSTGSETDTSLATSSPGTDSSTTSDFVASTTTL
jgi:hypothetical protein